MKNTHRFDQLFAFARDLDRTPVIEWADWWDKTICNWHGQGLPQQIKSGEDIKNYFGQDKLYQFWLPVRDSDCPGPSAHGGPIIADEKDYEKIKKHLYTDRLLRNIEQSIKAFLRENTGADYAYWMTMDGFFWFPRTLLGIENHLFAFYDSPELMHAINHDLCAYHKSCIEVVCALIAPKFMTFAEDMSYNGGPMISKEKYDEFMLPYYKELTPVLKAKGVKVLIDTDGDVEPLIPWFLEGGIQGILPLERMAGVDINRIRRQYPDLIMIGGYDKTVMHKGEEAMRAEFERILPVIRCGGYIPAVDHQTPPDVSLENYNVFMMLLKEYSKKVSEK
ncbi:MAG TPA: uroporphyrinogen decarboxylase family protein [Clostridia bacterium]|nr:uroporphyrinogen decarboxylase family protein [Clostridia bacterium]